MNAPNSQTNFIEIYDNALTESECDYLISLFEKSPQSKGGFYLDGQYTIQESTKKCDELQINFSNNSKFSEVVYPCLCQCISKYKKTHQEIDYISHWSLENNCIIQKYESCEDGYKQWHCEHGLSHNSYRVLAWTIYLNDAEGTEFYKFGKFGGVKGSCAIWPAGWTHLHRSAPNKGLKYIITGLSLIHI